MLNNIHPKYALSVIPKKNSPYNPIHNAMDGCMATIIDLTEGKRGWIAYKPEEDYWSRVHTSPIEIVDVFEDGSITVTTKNTVYRLTPLAQR